LEFGGSEAVETKLRDTDSERVRFEVSNATGEMADVEIRPSESQARFSVTPRGGQTGRIVARTGGVTPAFGLGDLGVRNRDRTELTGYANEDFHGDGGQCGRLISDFAIFPRSEFAEVNVEPGSKIVRLSTNENAQGTRSGAAMPALYYFFGKPEQIYASFLEARNHEGYRVFKPKYEWFGVGWEAFGALAWDTNEKTVTENVERYLSLGYPLSWMVVGSGFWPRQSSNTLATTSFGLWDTNLYPHPRQFIATAHERGLKFMLGLRISFITNGPFADEGVKNGCFLQENGATKVFRIAFPKSPCYLLDAQNPAAVRWYAGLCQKWLDFGVDGFKEDLFGYGKYTLRDDKLDPVNAALMERGVYVMGRNGYLGSPMDLQRFEDFNMDQNQDRGPLNGLAFAYSGFPYVYPDIVGGTFGENHRRPPLTSPVTRAYMMRNAQYASVNPSMSMGMGPWNFGSEQVERVMLEAAQLHGRLQPYIFSAAMDAFETGFPWTLAPLPLLWPDDPAVYKLENAKRRGYQWMLGPSLLACPLYGDDYATAETRDVYLPAGRWMDYATGEIYEGPRTLKGFPLPPGKAPLFVGGQGILVERALGRDQLTAVVYPVCARGTQYRFTHRDGATRSVISNRAAELNEAGLTVTDTTANKPVAFAREPRTQAIRFAMAPGHDYEISSR
jgi:alpha-glucosidase (family GH31 glycosyl hydrolase)